MKRIWKLFLAASVMLTLASFAAAAYPVAQLHSENLPGKAVPITQEIKDFFSARGANPDMLGLDRSKVSDADWTKIEAIINTPDDLTVTTDDHDVLNALIDAALFNATTAPDDPVYIDLGDQRWTYYQQTTIAPTTGG
jgi:hypothetical protein